MANTAGVDYGLPTVPKTTSGSGSGSSPNSGTSSGSGSTGGSTTPPPAGGYTYSDSLITGKDYTSDDDTRFNGLPGQPEVWYEANTGKVYMVYFPPGFNPPVPLMYHVKNEEVLKAFFGDQPMGYDKKFSSAQLAAAGAVEFGSTSEIPSATGDPWTGFVQRMERAKEVMPWLADPGIYGVVAAAYLEGRDPYEWEYEGTEYWSTHTEGERAWLKKAMADPATAAQDRASKIVMVRNTFQQMGVFEPPDDMVTYMADKGVMGLWTDAQISDQIKLSLGVQTGGTLDAGLTKYGALSSVNHSDSIRNLYDTWLGPAFAPSDADVQRWTNNFLIDPASAQAQLTEQLRQQRLALFPEYTNPNSTYQDIAGPWKSYVSGIWGTIPDDTDADFQRMIRLNDASAVAKDARKVGFARDYDRVKQQALGDMQQQMGQNVRGAV